MTPLSPPQSEFSPFTLSLLGLALLLLLGTAPTIARIACRLFSLEKANFRGDVIPASIGIGFVLVALVCYGGLSATDAPLGASSPIFLLVAAGFGILGLLDDVWGNRAVGGFRGHLGALAKGRPTTGVLKLVGGGVVAFAASYLLNGPHALLRLVLDALIIALSANALNLLDVRPGRAQFGFLLLCLPTLYAVLRQGMGWIALHPPASVLLGPVALAALTEWWPDSRGRAMMGDTGSNLLGAVAGLAAVTVLPLSGCFFLFAFLILFNWGGEKVSYTEIVERTPWLRDFDRQLGAR